MKQKLFSILALLLMAATGAMADDVPQEAGHEYVDLGLSVRWATCNVGATSPEQYGDYFAWGETATKSDYTGNTYTYTADGGNTMSKYNDSDNKKVLDAADDAAAVKWGGNWRMPTLAEIQELLNADNCTWEWQAAGNTTFGGVAGYKVTSKKEGYTDKYIFLPAAGFYSGTACNQSGAMGIYWSATREANATKRGCSIDFSSEGNSWQLDQRYFGFSVRPVCTPTTYSVTLADGTEDADQWQAKVGAEGAFTVLPVEGLEGGETVTIQYNGTRRIKSVTAVMVAPEEEIEAKGTDLSLLDNAGNAREKMWTANCYMVHTAGDYKLPLVYGNAIKDGETNAAAYTGVSNNSNATATFPRHDGSAITAPWIKDNGFTVAKAELLWQDAQGLVTEVGITGHYLTLTIGKNATEQEGNAIVAAELEDGTIVWSWHIWVTKETYENLETVNTGNHEYQVTPTNLGWVTTDLAQHKGYSTYYQWGRKDAFIPGDGETYSGVGANHKAYDINNQEVTGFLFEKSTTITTADNIKHPTTFYQDTQASGPNNTKYYNMWDAQQTGVGNIATATVKTVYDPCPVGFCVPTSNLYYFMEPKGDRTADDNWNNGKIFSNTFYPACGLRTGGTNAGKVTYAGNSGYYWSASASGSTSGYRIYFDAGYWYSGGVSRLMGQSIRPVAEE